MDMTRVPKFKHTMCVEGPCSSWPGGDEDLFTYQAAYQEFKFFDFGTFFSVFREFPIFIEMHE